MSSYRRRQAAARRRKNTGNKALTRSTGLGRSKAYKGVSLPRSGRKRRKRRRR